MRLSCDRAGYPLLEDSEAGLQVSLLPTTKAQFERFLAEPGEPGDAWYEARLAENPRVSWHHFDAADRERLFLTGITPEETLAFSAWLGPGFRLPTVAEWRAVDNWLAESPFTPEALQACPMGRSARETVERLAGQLAPPTWRDLALLRGGVMEWVRTRGGFAGLGAPRGAWLPNLFDPQNDDPQRPTRGERSRYFGFRLVRPWQGGGARSGP
jgi:formylglycine-generating enzyme required for sulfatase activity